MAAGDVHVWARFDDLVAGTARSLTSCGIEVVATDHRDVAQALDTVDAHVRAGRWAFGFLAYEAAPGLDPTLQVHEPVEDLPLVWFAISDEPPAPVPALSEVDGCDGDDQWTVEWTPGEHARAVRAVRDHIAAGETYQCNLTTRLTASATREHSSHLYRRLALSQRGAHNAFVDTGRHIIASASPELFFRVDGHRVTMRPMKGTAARGRTTTEDAQAVLQLRSSAKERAENIMIVDLVRNDLNRIARAGSVSAPRLLRAERYPTVHQLTSDVVADIREDVTLTDMFRALFPCGSITGAPKARTMQLIRDVEPGPRGVYCGAIGVVGPPRSPGAPPAAEFSVAIRTAVIDTHRGAASYGTGGGITWDSDPHAEYLELQTKSRILSARPAAFHLIETLRYDPPAGLHLLDEHLHRATDSARYFGFTLDAAAVRAELLALATTLRAPSKVRVQLYRDGRWTIGTETLPAEARRELVVAIDDEAIDSTQCWAHHKTSRREPYDERLARHPAADDVLLINERGRLTESCRANLFLQIDGQWFTPPASDGCLPGVMRGHLLARGHVRERSVTPADLTRASSIALASSLRGWRTATLLPTHGVGEHVRRCPA